MTTEIQQSASPIYSGRPIIEIDQNQHEIVQEMLVAMTMREQEGGMSSMELRFNNTSQIEQSGIDLTFEYSDFDQLSLGNSIRILAGDDEDPQEIFQGTISALEFTADMSGAPELTVLAEDSLQKARMARHTRLHQDVSLTDIIDQLGSEIGLTCQTNNLDINIGSQMQLNESNLAFLRRLLARYDGDMQIVGDELQAFARSDTRRNTIALEYGSQLLRIRIVADLADQVSQITYSGWDATEGSEISVNSESDINLGQGTGRTGSEILVENFSERSEHLGNIGAADATEAQALVNSAFCQRARRFVQLEGTSVGNPSLRIGTHVELQQVGPRFENTYYVTETCHRFDLQQGYQTDFKAECAYFEG